jgi:hypothetical integral membrane protein (TIGR02206 family)
MRRFVLFGAQHFLALAAIVAATLAAVAAVRRDPRGRSARLLRLGLAILLPALWTVEYAIAWRQGSLTLQVALPFHLCDVARILAIAGLLALDRRLVEPLYFFALAGTVPALLTPDVMEPFPHSAFLIFFVPHGLTVLAACLLVWGFQIVPTRGAWWRSWLVLNACAALAGLLNRALGTNFFYLAAKPPSPTPFDWLGSWPWYILTLEAVTLLVFLGLDMPLRARRDARRAVQALRAGRLNR